MVKKRLRISQLVVMSLRPIQCTSFMDVIGMERLAKNILQ